MDLNKNNVKKILGIITFTILLFVGVQRLDVVLSSLTFVFQLIFPFLLGAAIAFILNVPMNFIENTIFNEKSAHKPLIRKLKRPISLIITLIIVLGIIFLVVFLVLPEIVNTTKTIGDRLPDFFARVERSITELVVEYPFIEDYIINYNFDWEQIINNLYDFVKNSGGDMLLSTFNMASSILGALVNFLLGFIFSVYILLQKERLGLQSKKLLYAYLPEQIVDKILSVCSLGGKTFSKFLSGQGLEAVILGGIFFIAMSIFKIPYALMVSVLIGFTALIPVFGAFIGCLIGTFLILIVDPVMALWFIILFVILQQIEGNFIYPHVVGGSIGLPSIWVLVAVTLGGSTMGIAGMLIFIPLSSVVYVLLREAMYKRIRSRKIPSSKYR